MCDTLRDAEIVKHAAVVSILRIRFGSLEGRGVAHSAHGPTHGAGERRLHLGIPERLP
jgi:hypothetical protein